MSRVAIAVAWLLVASPVFAAEQTVRMHVENMTCAACPIAVRTAMGRVPGVKEVKVDLVSKTATVIFDDLQASTDTIAEVSRLAGFPARIQE
jgi:mercuric ion binding protein